MALRLIARGPRCYKDIACVRAHGHLVAEPGRRLRTVAIVCSTRSINCILHLAIRHGQRSTAATTTCHAAPLRCSIPLDAPVGGKRLEYADGMVAVFPTQLGNRFLNLL